MPRASRDSIMAKQAREKSVVTRQEEVRRQHEIFTNAIMEGHNQVDAARAAGYHPSTATSVMRNEEVQLMLAEARKEITDISTIKRIDVLNVFLDAIEMARTLADPAQMINGAKEVGKMLGFYEPEKVDIKLSMDSNVLAAKMRQMTDDELYELAAKKAKTVDGEVIDAE